MRIAIGSDHRGVELKQSIINQLEETGHSYEDFGSFTTESVDFPDFALPVAKGVASGDFERGILICDTGIGMSIAANKIKGIRAALCRSRQPKSSAPSLPPSSREEDTSAESTR
jgi:ribose 5-phosphate isomerase B